MVHLVSIAQLLQLTVPAFFTEHTEVVVLGENKLQYLATVFFQLLGIGLHHQSLPGWIGAGRNRPPLLFNFYHTHSAGADVA